MLNPEPDIAFNDSTLHPPANVDPEANDPLGPDMGVPINDGVISNENPGSGNKEWTPEEMQNATGMSMGVVDPNLTSDEGVI